MTLALFRLHVCRAFLYARLQTGRIMVWWCPSDSPSVRPTLRPSLRPGLRPPIFRTFLLHALTYWAEILHMTLFWCTTDQVRLSSLFVNFWRSYASVILEYRLCAVFPHFSPTCLDILSWNFAYDFVSPYYRSSLSVVNLRQCLWELCPFWNFEYWKYTVFRTFLLQALIYWAEILHITLHYCSTD